MNQKPSSRRRRSITKSILRLPDLEHAKAAALTASTQQTQSEVIVTPSMSSLTGIALNPAWRSTGSWSCGIALISNPGNWLTAEQGNALWQAPDRQRLKGCKQRIRSAVNHRIGIEPNP
jgi:hypothetical protein